MAQNQFLLWINESDAAKCNEESGVFVWLQGPVRAFLNSRSVRVVFQAAGTLCLFALPACFRWPMLLRAFTQTDRYSVL